MKHLFSINLLILSTFLFLHSGAMAQTADVQKKPVYDAELAKKLGADDMGMKSYIFVILKTGPNKISNKDTLNTLFAGHFANINNLAREGKLIVAGPMGNNDKNYRGIFILNVKTFDEAKVLLENDPTIKQKFFDVELYEWYGSAALPVYLETHSKIEKRQPK
ncbi:MAG: YciI family protein [Bacteroidales bacterium]